jgi:CheY-like chemotaxis protein
MVPDPPRLPSLRGLTVLVVEDDPDSRDVLEEVFRSAGATVSTASNVDSALTILRTARYDAVVSDLAMPGRDGLALIAEVRSSNGPRGGKLPAIALTGFPERYEKAAQAAGYDAFFRKPVDFEGLCTRVRDLAEGRVF